MGKKQFFEFLRFFHPFFEISDTTILKNGKKYTKKCGFAVCQKFFPLDQHRLENFNPMLAQANFSPKNLKKFRLFSNIIVHPRVFFQNFWLNGPSYKNHFRKITLFRDNSDPTAPIDLKIWLKEFLIMYHRMATLELKYRRGSFDRLILQQPLQVKNKY